MVKGGGMKHLALCFLVLLAGTAFAQDRDTGPYLESLTVDCKLGAASVLTDHEGKITSEAVAPDSPELTITFSGFDPKTNRAMMIGNQGGNPVIFYEVGDHLQIVELTDSKNVATTTISFSKNGIRAVHTRHMWLLDGGVFSTYAGPCLLR